VEDQELLDRINRLAHEEEGLYGRLGRGEVSFKDRERIREIEVELDQCWDLLHQRRALRRAGLDPDEAVVRDVSTVEGYVD
jgi:hypothetical protein